MSNQFSNPTWDRDEAMASFDGTGPHANILQLLAAAGGRDQFLNVGYSHRGQSHWGGKAQTRLVDRLAKRVRKLSKLDPDLLDVGCGRGGPAVHLRQKWDMYVTGIDLSERNVEIARRRTRDLAIVERLTFKRADVAHLPFSDATFSMALAIESLAYVPDKPQALDEIRRVLRPGGALAMAVLLVDEEAVHRSSENLATYQHFLSAWDFHGLLGAESYKTLLRNAGFTISRSELATERTLLPHAKRLSRVLRLWKADSMYRMSAWYVGRKTEADLDPVRDQLTASHLAIEAGLLEYGHFWAS